MTSTPDTEVMNEKGLELLVFDVAAEDYALRLNETREIVKTPAVTPVPNAPEYIVGVANLRGQVITIVDLATMFGLEKSQKKHVDTVTDAPAPKEQENKEQSVEEKADEKTTSAAQNTPAAGDSTHVIVVEYNDEFFGLQVANAKEVLRASQSALQQTPDVVQGKEHSHFLQGVIVLQSDKEKTGDEKIILLLNLAEILGSVQDIPSASTPSSHV